MADRSPVTSAQGHIAFLEEFAGRERERIAAGEFPVSEERSRHMLEYYERRAEEWRRALERAIRTEADGRPRGDALD